MCTIAGQDYSAHFVASLVGLLLVVYVDVFGINHVAGKNLIVPLAPLDGANLIAASDLVISAGGTINREAAALGVPAASIYAGQWAAVDEQLVHEGRLHRISGVSDIEDLPLRKKRSLNPRRATHVIDEVVNLVLEK